MTLLPDILVSRQVSGNSPSQVLTTPTNTCIALVSFQTPGASCTKTCVDFIMKPDMHSNPENYVRPKESGCLKRCKCTNPRTIPLHIPITMEPTVNERALNASIYICISIKIILRVEFISFKFNLSIKKNFAGSWKHFKTK